MISGRYDLAIRNGTWGHKIERQQYRSMREGMPVLIFCIADTFRLILDVSEVVGSQQKPPDLVDCAHFASESAQEINY
jgi:hypothetical protein